jgi:hypothetical protein
MPLVATMAAASVRGLRPARRLPDAFTKLLLHCDGVNASTTFTDSSANAFTVTPNGNAQISTAQSKFGGASALFDGSGDYLSIADHADFEFGSGDFTIDWWMRPSGLGGSQTIITKRAGLADSGSFHVFASGASVLFYASSSGSGSWEVASGVALGTIADNTWSHHEVVRSGNNFYCFKDGVQTGSTSSALTLVDEAHPVLIGGEAAGQYYNGCIDELRISKGIARHTSAFSPPTAAY